ncbi:ABC transporter family protein [Spironucleus salmonicida]|uniref:ABC transporter family protein n=1 Tax=Spironucleus salmonicida TaxID=348837 RepID=V6LPL8_9EUKA|nr:ABC transporter family protein [Spironucleus salmonicida]|eukprot:EST46168.1 ABC transporter family protein [Spironucleus salmonicida]
MRKPLKGMMYYEYLTLNNPIFILIIIAPAISAILIKYFFNAVLPSEFILKPIEQQKLFTIKGFEYNIFNYSPFTPYMQEFTQLYTQNLKLLLQQNIDLKYVPSYNVNIKYDGFSNYQDLELFGVVDLINQNPSLYDYYLLKYGITTEQFTYLKNIYKPSLFSIIEQNSTIQIIYNQTAFDQFTENQSFTVLTFFKYYNNILKNIFYLKFVETSQSINIQLQALPNNQNSYQEFANVDRATIQLSFILLLTCIQYFSSRDRGNGHFILRQASLNEYIYWTVRLFSTLIFSFLSSIILLIVCSLNTIGYINALTWYELFYCSCIISLQVSSGALLISAVFGGKSVILPLIISIILGISVNFILEIIFYNIMASESVYDPSIINQGIQVLLTYVMHGFSMFFITDKAQFQDNSLQLCGTQTTLEQLCIYTIPSFQTQFFISLLKFTVYLTLTYCIAYTKKELCWPGRIIPRFKRRRNVNNQVNIDLLTIFNKKTKIIQNANLYLQNQFKTSLIGLSGCGKSTLLQVLSGQQKPNQIQGTIYGYNLSSFNDIYLLKRIIGYCPQNNCNIFTQFSVKQNIMVISMIKGLQVEAELGLDLQSKQKIYTLSGGQLRRVSILNSIQGINKILFLDEITSGLDPLNCSLVDTFLQEQQISFILSTHDMIQVQNVAQNFLIIQNHQILLLSVQDIINQSLNKLAIKVFVDQISQDQIIQALHQQMNLEPAFKVKNYFQINVTQVRSVQLQEIIQLLEQFKQNNQIDQYQFLKQDITEVLQNFMNNEQLQETGNIMQDQLLKQNKFLLFQKFFFINESKSLLPFYLLFPVILLVFVMFIFGISCFLNNYLDTEVLRLNNLVFASLQQECQLCCGNFNPDTLIQCKTQNNCFSSTQGGFYSPGSCYQLQLLLGFEADDPKVRNLQESVYPFYSGQLQTNQILIKQMSRHNIYINKQSIYYQNYSFECQKFLSTCYFGCKQTINIFSCEKQCLEMSKVQVSCTELIQRSILQYDLYENEQPILRSFINQQKTVDITNSEIDNFGGLYYQQLQVSQLFPIFNRSYIVIENNNVKVLSHLPFIIGTTGYFEQILMSGISKQYAYGFSKNITPQNKEFFTETVKLIGQTQTNLKKYQQIFTPQQSSELFYSLGIGMESEFIDGIGFELSSLMNTQKSRFSNSINQILVRAYEHTPYKYQTSSFVMFLNQLLIVLLLVPFSFQGIKLGYDLSSIYENKQYLIFSYNNISKQYIDITYFCFRILSSILSIIMYTLLAFAAQIITVSQILILFIVSFVTIFTSCFIALLVLRLKLAPSVTTFIVASINIILIFLQMFMFKNSFLQIAIPSLSSTSFFNKQSTSLDTIQQLFYFTISLFLCIFILNHNPQEPILQCSSSQYQIQDAEISIQDVSVSISQNKILNSITLNIEERQIISLIGLSGSGKTTLLSALLGSQPFTGSIYLQNQPIQKNQFCFVPQFDIFFSNLTIKDHIDFFQALNQQKLSNLLDFLNLDDIKNRHVRLLSGGQKRRFSFAVALLKQSNLVLLDEVTTGLSPDLRKQIWQIISRLDRTIISTTHDIQEVEAISDRIVLLKSGKIHQKNCNFAKNVQRIQKDDQDLVIRGEDLHRFEFVSKNNVQSKDLLRKQFLDWIG